MFGRPSVAAARFEFMDRTTGTEREHRKDERKLKAVYEELRRHPARYRQVLDGMVIYERMPRWMRPVMPARATWWRQAPYWRRLGCWWPDAPGRCRRPLDEAALHRAR